MQSLLPTGRVITSYSIHYTKLYDVGAALVLIILELLVSEKKTRWIAKWNPLHREETVSS